MYEHLVYITQKPIQVSAIHGAVLDKFRRIT